MPVGEPSTVSQEEFDEIEYGFVFLITKKTFAAIIEKASRLYEQDRRTASAHRLRLIPKKLLILMRISSDRL